MQRDPVGPVQSNTEYRHDATYNVNVQPAANLFTVMLYIEGKSCAGSLATGITHIFLTSDIVL